MAAENPPRTTPAAAVKALDRWQIYKRAPGVVLGFHGCDASTGNALLNGELNHLAHSRNAYDWLGSGIYFWEADPWRALRWAEDARNNSRLTSKPVKRPYVVGAIIDPGHCCNLLDFDSCYEATKAFKLLQSTFGISAKSLPENRGGPDGVLRFRDRLVIETIHLLRERTRERSYDSVRAAFPEGDALYDGAGFRARSHIQLAVRNPDCIKGYFRLPGL